MTDQTYEQVKAEWALQVGWFSIHMGEVEAGVSRMLELVGKSAAKRDTFDGRITKLRGNIELAHLPLRGRLHACLDKAERLRGLRNTVLHSALRVEGWFEGVPEDRPVNAEELEGKQLFWRSKILDRQAKHTDIDLAEMCTLVADARSLSEELWVLTVWQWEIWQEASPIVE